MSNDQRVVGALNSSLNQQWCIARRPTGNVELDDFALKKSPIPECQDGQILLSTLYLNLAPLMRMYMSGDSIAGEAALNIGDVIHGRGVAEVIESKHPDYSVGDVIQGQIGWQTYKASFVTNAERISKIPHRGLSYGLSLGPLGMTGFSAYFGFFARGEPKAGETVVVSGAAGGVGSMVIQLAKIHGCKVIGIAGGSVKCKRIAPWCDSVIDYKSSSVPERLAELLPQGLDIYFDNVGGDILSACLDNLALNARIVLCGGISEYLAEKPYGLENYRKVSRVNASINGFFVYNHQSEFASAEDEMATWLLGGQLTPLVDISDGFMQMPHGLAKLYSHQNIGVAYCRVRRDAMDTFA